MEKKIKYPLNIYTIINIINTSQIAILLKKLHKKP